MLSYRRKAFQYANYLCKSNFKFRNVKYIVNIIPYRQFTHEVDASQQFQILTTAIQNKNSNAIIDILLSNVNKLSDDVLTPDRVIELCTINGVLNYNNACDIFNALYHTNSEICISGYIHLLNHLISTNNISECSSLINRMMTSDYEFNYKFHEIENCIKFMLLHYEIKQCIQFVQMVSEITHGTLCILAEPCYMSGASGKFIAMFDKYLNTTPIPSPDNVLSVLSAMFWAQSRAVLSHKIIDIAAYYYLSNTFTQYQVSCGELYSDKDDTTKDNNNNNATNDINTPQLSTSESNNTSNNTVADIETTLYELSSAAKVVFDPAHLEPGNHLHNNLSTNTTNSIITTTHNSTKYRPNSNILTSRLCVGLRMQFILSPYYNEFPFISQHPISHLALATTASSKQIISSTDSSNSNPNVISETNDTELTNESSTTVINPESQFGTLLLAKSSQPPDLTSELSYTQNDKILFASSLFSESYRSEMNSLVSPKKKELKNFVEEFMHLMNQEGRNGYQRGGQEDISYSSNDSSDDSDDDSDYSDDSEGSDSDEDSSEEGTDDSTYGGSDDEDDSVSSYENNGVVSRSLSTGNTIINVAPYIQVEVSDQGLINVRMLDNESTGNYSDDEKDYVDAISDEMDDLYYHVANLGSIAEYEYFNDLPDMTEELHNYAVSKHLKSKNKNTPFIDPTIMYRGDLFGKSSLTYIRDDTLSSDDEEDS